METAATLARSALERCARECTTRGWRLAMALLRNQDDAQDAVQQALLAATRKAHRVPHDDPWPWFAAVIAHEAANLRRRRARRAAVSIHSEESPMQPQHPQKGPDHAVEHAELASRLWRELDLLPADEQEALVLTQLGGLTYRQASEQLGVPLGTFNHRISRGLATLRRRLGASDAALLGCVPFLPTFEPPATLHAFVQGKVATLPQTLAAHYVTLGGILVKKSLLVVALAAAVIVMLAVSAAVIGAPHPQPERNGPRSNLPAMAEAEKPAGAAAADNRAVPLATAGNAPATSGTGKPAEPVATATQPEVAPQPERTVREADAAAREAERRAGGENSPEDDAPETVLDSATELDRRVVASLGLATRWVADEPARVIVPGPDGTCLYTAGEHVVARWNADTGERQWAVRVHGDEIQSMALSPDGSRLALATFTKHVPLVDARTGGREGSIAFSSYVFSVGFSPDGALLAGGQMDGVEVRSVADSTQVARLVLPENFPRLDPRDPPAFRQVAFGSDGGSVTGALLPGDSGRITSDFSGCYSEAAAFCRWEMAKPAEPVVFSGKALGVLLGTRAVISGNGQWAFVDAVEPGDYIKGEDEFRADFNDTDYEKFEAAYAAYVKARMAAGATGKPEVFMAAVDLQGGRVVHRVSLGGLGRENMPAAFSRDGASLAFWDRNAVQVLHTGNWSRRAVSAPYQVGALAFDAAGERIYCNDKDRIVRLRAGDAVALDAQVSLKPDNADIEIAADGSLVYFHMAGELLAWRHADRMVAWRRKGLVLAGGGALVEGANLLVCVDEATCEPVLVDPTTGDERRRLAWPEGLEKTGNLMAATDEGSVLAITSEPARDGDSWTELLVWRATEDYQPVRLRPEPLQGVPYKYLMGSPAISPDGKYVACCCWNGYRVVEVATGVASWIKTPHEFMNNAGLRFSPDSKELWAVGMGLHSGIYRMDVAKGELLGVVSFEAATGSEVSGKTFAVEPGGKTVLVAPAVGNSDKTLYRIEIATGKVVDHLKAHTSSLQALQLSPDGRWVATLDSSFVLHVWRMTE